MIIRRAALDDVDALAALHLATVSVAYKDFFPSDAPLPTIESLRARWEEAVATAHSVFVVDGCLGSVAALASGDVAGLHVHPSQWGEGLGQRLHDAAVEELWSHGHARAELWVIDRNERARSLYERNGWVVDPSRELDYLGVREVRYVLEKP